jgi:hypothetical protein
MLPADTPKASTTDTTGRSPSRRRSVQYPGRSGGGFTPEDDDPLVKVKEHPKATAGIGLNPTGGWDDHRPDAAEGFMCFLKHQSLKANNRRITF